MSLEYCPECGHETSNAAVACPNCGRPISAQPVVEQKVVAANLPRDNNGLPKWAFIPLALFGAVIIFILFAVLSRGPDESADRNINVDLSSQRTGRTESQTANVPSTSDSQAVTPGSQSSIPGIQTTVPGAQTTVADNKGTVLIDAKITTKSGQPQAVKNERFYLLDKDLEMILSDAGIGPIEGQTLANSFGLSVMYPERYGEFHRAALKAINDHIKYSGTTDSLGKTELKGVEPDSYYVFGVTRAGKGFAVWSAPVAIRAGQNALNLSPQRLTEIENTGE